MSARLRSSHCFLKEVAVYVSVRVGSCSLQEIMPSQNTAIIIFLIFITASAGTMFML